MTSSNEKNLTRKAFLTLASTLLQQIANFLVGFVVTPIVINGLGVDLYGAWRMIQQSIGYLSLTDMRPMGTLKYTLSVRQHVEDVEQKKRQIGSALRLWVITFPIFIIFGIVLILLVPLFIKTSPANIVSVRWGMGIVIFSVAMERLISLPANVLRGMNLDYKAMGLNALTVILGGVITYVTVKMGLGLPGVAAANVLGVILSGLVRLCVARKALSWFGACRPYRTEFKRFVIMSIWFLLGGLAGVLLYASDILLVGYVLGTRAAAVYAATGLALKMTTDPLRMLLSSAIPGLNGVCGKGDWIKVLDVRREILLISLAGMVVFAVGIIIFNESFLSLWVGRDLYGGHLTNLLLVLAATIKVVGQVDLNIVAGLLEIKKQSLCTFVSGILTVTLGYYLLHVRGMEGMAMAALVGVSLQWAFNISIIMDKYRVGWSKLFCVVSPAVSIVIAMISVAWWSVEKISILNSVSFSWGLFIVVCTLCVMVVLSCFYAGTGARCRRIMAKRIQTLCMSIVSKNITI